MSRTQKMSRIQKWIAGLTGAVLLLSIAYLALPRTEIKDVFTIGTAEAAGVADYTVDGIADDVQIQEAIDALPVAGGTIIVLTGAYNFATSVNVNDTNIHLTGYGATIQPSANITYAFNITGTYVNIEGFTIDGSEGGFSIYNGIYAVSPATHVKIINNTIHSIQLWNPGVSESTNIFIDNGVTDVIIENNTVRDSSASVYGIMVGHYSGGGAAVSRVNVSNNHVSGITYNGIGIYNDTSEFVVDGNIVESGTGHNTIAVSPGHNGVISNNHVSGAVNASESGIEIETNTAHGAFDTYSVTVIGNVIEDGNPGIEINASDARTIRDIVVTGNILRNPFGEGITVNSGAGSVYRLDITSNSIFSAASHGIVANSVSGYLIIDGNYIVDSLSSGVILNSPDYAVISNNIVDNSNTALTTNHAVRILGTSTYLVVEGNLLINTQGNAVNEGYGFYSTALADSNIVLKNNIMTGNYSFGAYISGASTTVDLMPVSVEMDLSNAAEDFPVFTAIAPSQIAGYTVFWNEAAGDANTTTIRVGEVTSGGVADDDEFDSYVTAGSEALGRNDSFYTANMTDTQIAVGTTVTVGHTQKTGNGKVIITLWIVQQVN